MRDNVITLLSMRPHGVGNAEVQHVHGVTDPGSRQTQAQVRSPALSYRLPRPAQQ
jgi:hypothetical protein